MNSSKVTNVFVPSNVPMNEFFHYVSIFEYIMLRKQRNYHILESNWSKETNEPILETPEYELLKYTMYGCDNDMLYRLKFL